MKKLYVKKPHNGKELAQSMDITALQMEFANTWKHYMEHTQIGTQDATCYESYIEYPTDIKLLWQCSEKVYEIIQKARKKHKLPNIKSGSIKIFELKLFSSPNFREDPKYQ